MKFLGQTAIMNQLSILIPDIVNNDRGVNILIRGPSGWGKTRLATMICNVLAGRNFQFSIADKSIFDESFRVHLIDEAHLLKEPEVLYPIMDSGRYVMIFTTNSVTVLPEALVRRCYNFNLAPYTKEELIIMAGNALWDRLSGDCVSLIVDSANGSPAILMSIIQRINLYQRNKRKINSVGELIEVLKNYVGIVNGLDEAARRYLECLKNLGGVAGLDTLSTLLHINKDALRYDIEPILLEKRLIKVTSKGRILNG